MKEATVLESVGAALRATTKFLTAGEIAKAAKVDLDSAKISIKLLSDAGQIEVRHAARGRENSYGWLASAKPVLPATTKREAAPVSDAVDGPADQPSDAARATEAASAALALPVIRALDPLRDDLATTLRRSGIAAFAHVNAESDLAMAVAGLVEEYHKAQMRPVPTEPGEPQGAAYLVKASKRKPRITRDKDAACAAALAAARKGSTRAEVFALIPVGAAKPGAEWNAAL